MRQTSARVAAMLRGGYRPLSCVAFWLCTVLLMTVFAVQLHAQAGAGMVGTVTDSVGSVIPDAEVEIVNNDTGTSLHVTTSGAGTYAANGLLPGRYTVTVQSAGFKKSVKSQVLIEIGTTATINLALDPGAATETVSVVAESVALNTTQPQLGTTIETELINSLPNMVSGRGRQIDQFQYLSPGVQGGAFVHEVSGGVNFQQEVVVNGVPMPQSETEGMTTYINPPWELIHEFRIERSTFAAQYGLGQGAVNYQTTSGTNKFHGDVFEINRNSSLDSKGFVNTKVPTDHENNYGFSIGGPVWLPRIYKGQDRTFFHFSSEWFKQNATVTGNNDTVPTEQERTGDFSDFVDGTTGKLIPIYDPTTGQQFVSNGVKNVIPAGRLSANSKALLQYLPNPDRAGLNVGGLDQNRNYNPYANPTLNSNWGFTLDHNLTKSQSLHWAEWRNKLTTNQVFVTGPLVAPPNPLNSVATELQLGTGFILNYSNLVTPHLVMTAGAGWMGEINNETPVTHVSLPSVTDGVVMPQISFDGQHAPTQWGSSGSLLASINRKLAVTFVNNWMWSKGRQTFNFGWEARRLYQDALQSGSGGGQFSFSHNSTSTPPLGDGSNDPTFSNSGSSFASFMLGLVDSANRTFSQQMKLRNLDISPYIQDDIKLTPRLTVNAGLRWDIMVPFTAVGNNVAFLDPTAKNTYTNLAGTATTLGHCSTCIGWDRADIHWGHFGPRFGFAYMLNNKTVLQAGFSLAFLNGGAYSFGDTLVANNYSSLLAGTYTMTSSGSNVANYGSWDSNKLASPGGSAIGPTSGVANTIYELSRNDGYAPYTQQWNINVQRQLPHDIFLTAAYVGNREIHIISNLNHPNQYPSTALQLGAKLNESFATGQAQADGFALPYANFVKDFGSNATVYQSLKPFPQYAQVTNSFEGSGSAFYNGAQIQLEKRYTNGLAFLYSLTLARTMSNNDFGNASGFSASGMDKYRQSQEYGVASSDQKYNTKLSGTYELPLGKGKPFLNTSSVLNRVIGGWQIGGILDYEGGSPYSVSQPGYAFQPNGFNRPNRVSSVHLQSNSSKRVKDYYLNKTTAKPLMFTPGAFADTGSDYVLGNAAREYSELRGSPYRNENLTAKKSFTIFEHVKATIQVDFYNALNRAILSSNPDTNVRDTSFGYVTGKSQSNSNRQGQGTLKLEF